MIRKVNSQDVTIKDFKQIFRQLVDPDSHARQANRYKTIGDVKSHYGDRVETVLKQIQLILETVRFFP